MQSESQHDRVPFALKLPRWASHVVHESTIVQGAHRLCFCVPCTVSNELDGLGKGG